MSLPSDDEKPDTNESEGDSKNHDENSITPSLLETQNAAPQTKEKSGAPKIKSQESTSDRIIAESTRQIAGLTKGILFTAIFSAIFSGGQWLEIRSGGVDTRKLADAAGIQATALLTQNALANPPKIRITNVRIDADPAPTSFHSGDIIEGFLNAGNVGTTALDEKYNVCLWYWRKGPLPMRRPYDPIDFHATAHVGKCSYFLVGKNCIELHQPIQIEPGVTGTWQFKTQVPADYTPDMNFYIMGHIDGTGASSTRYTSLFIRKYDVREGRFVRLNPSNEDYDTYE